MELLRKGAESIMHENWDSKQPNRTQDLTLWMNTADRFAPVRGSCVANLNNLTMMLYAFYRQIRKCLYCEVAIVDNYIAVFVRRSKPRALVALEKTNKAVFVRFYLNSGGR